MKLRFIFLALVGALGLNAPPAAVRAQPSASYTFLKAVRDRDGKIVTETIQKPGSGAVIIDTRDPTNGEGALHIITRGRDLQWLNFLLASGAKADLRDNDGNTPLLLAASLPWHEGTSVLLQRRASVDMANNAGETPLIRAVQNRDIDMVKILLMAGANPNKRDFGSGLSARDYAARDSRASLILRAIDEARPRPKSSVGPN